MHTGEANISNVIPFCTLARQVASAQAGRSPGPDAIPSDPLKTAPLAVAKHLHPFLVKVSLQAQEPLLLKGSRATDLWKGKGSKLDMPNFRSIVCNSVLSKHHHKFLRSRLYDLVVHFLADSQCGGIPKRGVDMAGLTLRSFQAVAHMRRFSSFQLFLDVRTAYYAVVRQLLLPVPLSRDEALDVLDSVDIPVAMLPLLEESLSRPALIPQVTGDPHLANILTDAHQDTWFTVPGVTTAAATLKGTRPGDSLADMLFSILLKPALFEVRELLEQLGVSYMPQAVVVSLFARASDPEEAPASDTTFADDVCFMGAVPASTTPEALPQLLSNVASAVHGVMVKRGLSPNYDAGKSELMVSTSGRYARRFRQQLFLLKGVPIHGSADTLLFAGRYKHLGSIVVEGATMHAELAARRSKHISALAPLSAAVYKHRVHPSAAINLTDSLATSVLFSGAAAWWPLSSKQLSHLDHRLAEGYRRALGWKPFSDDKPHRWDTIFQAAGKLPAAQFLSLTRLRFLYRLLTAAPAALRLFLDELIAVQDAWPLALLADIAWAKAQFGLALPSALAGGPAEWFDYITSVSAASWKSTCKLLQKHAVRHQRLLFQQQRWHSELRGITFSVGSDPPPFLQLAPQHHKFWVCYDCGGSFTSSVGYAAHRRWFTAASAWQSFLFGVPVVLGAGLSSIPGPGF